jgi:hypothetical protein
LEMSKNTGASAIADPATQASPGAAEEASPPSGECPLRRPTSRDPAVKERAIAEIAAACAEWAKDKAEDWLEPLRKCRLYEDAYQIARDLERYAYVDPDFELVEILTGASHSVWQAERDAVKAWVAECGIVAPLTAGTRVGCSRGVGEITSIREDEASYIVLPDAERDDPKFSRGGGWLIHYEDASAIEARRAETQGGSVADESAVAESETPKDTHP